MKTLISILCIFASVSSYGQTVNELQKRLDQYNDVSMPEHVWLHLDRDSYFAGDRIWYAIYLNNTPRAASALSAVAYVELRDARDSVVVRQKVKCREGLGHADLLLSSKLRTGNYKMLAYTMWMHNNQEVETFQVTIPIVNLDLPLIVSGPGTDTFSESSDLQVTSSGPGQFRCKAAAAGSLVAFDREEILLVEKVNAGSEVSFSCSNRIHDEIGFALLNESGDIKTIQSVACLQDLPKISISVSRSEVKPRQKFEITIDLADKLGNAVASNISVSVRSTEPGWEQLAQKINKPWLAAGQVALEGGTRKEMFVYPVEQRTLHPVQMASPPVPFEIRIDSTRARYIEESGTARNIMRTYGMQYFAEREAGYNIPFNISYVTKDYLSLPTIEEFIREVVMQIKIRKSSGEKMLFLRYMDDNSLVYHFKQPALLLVDGAAFAGGTDFLQTPLPEIERIDLTWGMREINSMGVFSLADNGVISIQTKAGSFRKGGGELLKEYVNPHIFNTSRHANAGDEIPDLGEPVYWNPLVPVNGRTRIEVEAPDRSGEMIIQIEGLTTSGQRISGESRVRVTLDEN